MSTPPPFNLPHAAANTGDSKKKPCRVCTDFTNWTHKQSKGKKAPEKENTTESKGNANINDKKGRYEYTEGEVECPPDRSELGRHSWTLLHSMAAYYPEKPTTKEQKDMKDFINLFSRFYPCDDCATHLRKSLVKHPAKTESREELSQYMCELHNEVNKYLGKPQFDCSRILERWRDGWKDGSCD